MPQKLINRDTGQPEIVEDADLPAALASKKYEQPSAVAVHQLGDDTYVAPGILGSDSNFTQAIDPEKAELAKGYEVRRQQNSGLGGMAKSAAGGVASGLTLGIANPYEEAQEFNPIESVVGQIGGAILPGLIPGAGEAEIAGAIARDGVSTERVAGSLSSKFLYGGEVAGGKAGEGLERAMLGAGEHIDRMKAVAALPEDLGALDAAGLRTARETELDQLAASHGEQRVAAKSGAVDDVLAYQQKIKESNPYLVTGEGSAAAPFTKAGKSLRNALDDVEGLRENPGAVLKPLRQQAQALEKTIAERDAIATKFAKVNERVAGDLEEDLATLPDATTHVELSGKAAKRYSQFADVKLGKAATISVAREDAQGFLEALRGGEVQGAGQKALGELDGLLEQNKALQAKLKTAGAPAIARSELSSSRLTAIDAARDAIASPKAKSLSEEMLGGSIMGHVAGAFSGMPIIGPMIGAKAGRLASDLVFGRLGTTAATAAERTKAATTAFLDVATRATPTLPVAATRVLAEARFSPRVAGEKEPTDLAGLFKKRSDEIKSQTAYGPDGVPVMRPEARAAVAERLTALRASSPILADRLETMAARRMSYLSSIIPRKPDINGIPIGPDNWKPSELAMRSFARSMSAVEDPHGVEERLARGQVTPEDAAAYHAVYPDRAEALKAQIMTALPTLSKKLPYGRRLALSIFSGVPVDPSLDPRILGALQQQFAKEEGSEGGTEAPKAKPAFGSVRADIMSSSQERESVIK